MVRHTLYRWTYTVPQLIFKSKRTEQRIEDGPINLGNQNLNQIQLILKTKKYSMHYIYIHSLKLTYPLKVGGCEITFFLGFGLFSGAMLVWGRVHVFSQIHHDTSSARGLSSPYSLAPPLVSFSKVTNAVLAEKVSSCSPIFGQRIRLFISTSLVAVQRTKPLWCLKKNLNTTQFEGTTQGPDVSTGLSLECEQRLQIIRLYNVYW